MMRSATAKAQQLSDVWSLAGALRNDAQLTTGVVSSLGTEATKPRRWGGSELHTDDASPERQARKENTPC